MQVAAIAAIPVLVLVIVRRRGFCRFVCPTGTCLEIAGRAGLKRRAPHLPNLGRWIGLAGLVAAAVGYPILFWLDPLSIFSASFGLSHGAYTVAAFGLPFLVALSLLWPGFWCAKLCPLGGTQDWIAWLLRAVRSPTIVHFRTARRSALAAGLGAAWAAAALRWSKAGEKPPMRPPGAVDDPEFSGLCVRCGNCIRVCPSQILKPDLGDNGIGAFLTPVVDLKTDYCREDCVRCTEACPTGAIARLDLETKKTACLGVVRVDMDICLLGNERECAICRMRCPYEAIRYVFNETSYLLTPTIDASRCNGCGACQVFCPTTPKAINVEPGRR